ncbi:MAG: SocA family protein [Christensenellaceae bacterium]|nr:SocA family protein [Christensenellaceae bacterium]
MAKVQDVVDFFVDTAQKKAEMQSGDLVTNLRLQKLLYFAQGWYLARYGKPLFEDDMLCWKYGPVVRTVYDKYKDRGKTGIENNYAFDRSVLSKDEFELLLDVLMAYDGKATSALVDISHGLDTPWSNTGAGEVITKEALKSYFSELKPLPSYMDKIKNLKVIVPKRNEKGQPIVKRSDWEACDGD